MINRHAIIAVGAMCAGLLVPAQASAETAITDANLNLRVGPSTSYGVIDVIPYGQPVEVIGCAEQYNWCDVAWDGLRGWVSARYLVEPGTSAYLPQWGPNVGVPIVSFSFSVYHDRHYHDRPWHRERHWSGHWRDRRDEARAERREEQQEAVRREEQQEALRREELREAERLQERREAEIREERREAESRQERQLPPGQQRRTEAPGQSGRALQQERGPRAEPPGRGRGRGGGQQEDWENRGR